MVKIIDITEEKEREKRETKLEMELASECFVGKKVKFLEDFYIQIFDKSQRLADKVIGISKMIVYDESVLSQAERFAQRYEEQFPTQIESLGEFAIKTDYSENS